MKRKRLLPYTFVALGLAAGLSCGDPVIGQSQSENWDMSQRDKEALALGRKVLAVQDALDAPSQAGSLKAVTDLGHDQRHYAMVRGWLGYLLQADESILQASQGNVTEAKRERIEFLKRSIRAIDLE